MNPLFEKSYSIFKLIYEMKNETVITYFWFWFRSE